MPSTLSVLLIEDSSDDVLLLEYLIERSGLPVELNVMNNGERALAYLQEEAATCKVSEVAQVILLDLALPGVSGIEILRRLKEDSRLQDIPVIILSGTERDDDIKNGQDLKAHTHITKPMSLYELTWIASSLEGYWRRIEKLDAREETDEVDVREVIETTEPETLSAGEGLIPA